MTSIYRTYICFQLIYVQSLCINWIERKVWAVIACGTRKSKVVFYYLKARLPHRSFTNWNKYIWLIRLTGQFNENNLTDSSDETIHFMCMHLLPISRQSVSTRVRAGCDTYWYQINSIYDWNVKQIQVEMLMNRLDIQLVNMFDLYFFFTSFHKDVCGFCL